MAAFTPSTRMALGLMSGMSMDGLDLALVRLRGAEDEERPRVELLASETVPYEAAWTAQFDKHHPEHLRDGLAPHGVFDRWYFGRCVAEVSGRTRSFAALIRSSEAFSLNEPISDEPIFLMHRWISPNYTKRAVLLQQFMKSVLDPVPSISYRALIASWNKAPGQCRCTPVPPMWRLRCSSLPLSLRRPIRATSAC